MNKFAVLASGFEYLSYPLGETNSFEGQSFSERKEIFVLRSVESEPHAHMLIGSYDWLSEHAASPIGYVSNKEDSFFVVCKSSRQALPNPAEMDEGERSEFSRAVITRLASLHTQGFGCGGISAETVEFTGRQAKLANPSAIFALSDSDSIFYEAVATLRSLAGKGFAKKEELESLAAAYVSFSPVCRHAIAVRSGKKYGLHKELAKQALRFGSYF